MTSPSDSVDLARRHWLQGSGAALAVAALASGSAAPVRAGVHASAPATPIRLDLNESNEGPSPQVAIAIQHALGQVPRYVQSEQAAALQQQIATFEGVSAEQVIIGEVLEALGQHLAIEQGAGGFVYSVPGYGALVDAAAPFGGRAVEVPLDARLQNDLPALSAAIAADTRALFVVNPHNPSGTLSPRDAFDAFVHAAAKRTLVIVDEAYLDYCDDFAQRTAVRLLRAGDNVVVFRTFGKLHALAGLQIGYAVAPRALADALRKRGIGAAHSLNQLSIAAAAASLADHGYRAQVRERAAHERQRWSVVLDELGLRRTEAAGNFVFFDTGRAQTVLAQALSTRGIRIGRAFPPYAQWARISIGTAQENTRVHTALREIVAGWPRSS